jgi:hypothetical protein
MREFAPMIRTGDVGLMRVQEPPLSTDRQTPAAFVAAKIVVPMDANPVSKLVVGKPPLAVIQFAPLSEERYTP